MTAVLPLAVLRAEALFTSDLPADSRLSRAQADAAIHAAVRTHGGTKGLAGDVAAEFGEHPELAVPRMRWAREVVADIYRRPDRQRHLSRSRP